MDVRRFNRSALRKPCSVLILGDGSGNSPLVPVTLPYVVSVRIVQPP